MQISTLIMIWSSRVYWFLGVLMVYGINPERCSGNSFDRGPNSAVDFVGDIGEMIIKNIIRPVIPIDISIDGNISHYPDRLRFL